MIFDSFWCRLCTVAVHSRCLGYWYNGEAPVPRRVLGWWWRVEGGGWSYWSGYNETHHRVQDQEEAGSSMGEEWGRAGTYTWHPWHQHHHADTSTDRSDDWVDIESGESQLTLDTLDTAKKSYHSSSVGQYSCVWTDRWVGGWTVGYQLFF